MATSDLYYAVLATVFADGASVLPGCFQMVSIESGAPEEIVFVTCDGVCAGYPSEVVHLVARENVRERLESTGADAAMHVGVRRSSAPIRPEDALQLGDVWAWMLERAKDRRALGNWIREAPRDYFVSGGIDADLSGFAESPAPSTPPGKLVEIGKLLARFADARPEERPALLSTIRSKARSLGRDVNGVDPGGPCKNKIERR